MNFQQQPRAPGWNRLPEQQNKTWGAIAGAAIGLVGTVVSTNKQSKAAKKARDAAASAQIDPQQVARLAREQARQNVADSLSLEMQYAPDNARFRNESIGRLRQLLAGGDPANTEAASTVRQLLAGQTSSPLFGAAVDRTGQELALGGQLDQETRNLVARNALANAGRVGGGRLSLGRFLVPRDLGLTSMQLRDARLGRAVQVGQQDEQNRANQQTLRSQLAALLSNLGSTQTNRALSLASFGQSLTPPVAGLDPGDVASLYSQNATNSAQAGLNAAQLQAQTGRNTAELFGGLGGLIQGIDWSKIFNRSSGGSATSASVPTFAWGYPNG